MRIAMAQDATHVCFGNGVTRSLTAFGHKVSNNMESIPKKELLIIIEKENLQVLKVDCCHRDYYDLNSIPEERRDFYKDIYPNARQYQSLEELDFKYDKDYDFDFLCGTVYCIDKITKEPVWIVRKYDDNTAWWEVNRVPKFYKNKFSIKEI